MTVLGEIQCGKEIELKGKWPSDSTLRKSYFEDKIKEKELARGF